MNKKQLIKFVTEAHKGQTRKGTDEPYLNHVLRVAQMAHDKIKKGHYAYEIGLCHDLIEDTTVTDYWLLKNLIHFGYPLQIAYHIMNNVIALTDYYTRENYPHDNRYDRKTMEFNRLSAISPLAQNIKACDIIDNIKDMKLEAVFGDIYIEEKKAEIDQLPKMQSDLYYEILTSLTKFRK